jgi:hypothetical protein
MTTVLDSSRKNPPFVEAGAPFQNIQVVLERTKICSWVPAGLEAKTDSAVEDKQEFSALK